MLRESPTSVYGPHDEWVAECGPSAGLDAPNGRGDHDARWIATMSPAAAKPLANVLRGTAYTLQCHPEYAEMNRDYLNLARAILGEAPRG